MELAGLYESNDCKAEKNGYLFQSGRKSFQLLELDDRCYD